MRSRATESSSSGRSCSAPTSPSSASTKRRTTRASAERGGIRMTVTFRLYTDFVCPFCFIAEESTVPALLRDYDLALDWRGFELHPGTPRGGMPLTQLFPGTHLPSLHDRTR